MLQMEKAIARGPHKSALTAPALAHFADEVREKVSAGQARLIAWDDIKHDPPVQLKISPIAAVPHNSKPYRSILDLSFSLRLEDGSLIPSVNDTTIKTAPAASTEQLGHSLARLIHAFAESGPDEKVFMAKWDVKDGFWRLQCQQGEEYNFAYVLPQEEGAPTILVIPTSLQMGWIESPGYFCSASETSRDVAQDYCLTPLGSLPPHKFLAHTTGHPSVSSLPLETKNDDAFRFLIEVFVDDFMSLVLATSRRQLQHVANGTMMGIHDVFPPSSHPHEDPISMKKLLKLDGQFSTQKTLLGFNFDGVQKTLWLQDEKRAMLLLILKRWLRASKSARRGVVFGEFESVIAKLRHAFTAIPAGVGLLSPCNKILALRPPIVYLHTNEVLTSAIEDLRTILRESTLQPTRCRELTGGWPHYIGYTDASSHGFGGIIVGETLGLAPTVFRGQWPEDITRNLLTYENPQGTITNSDLEMAGLLYLWLVMEAICPSLREKNVALLSDNTPTVSWVARLASKRSNVGARLIRALALRLKTNGCCPITPLHVAGKCNRMADMASRSFGSTKQWHHDSDNSFAAAFNNLFPLPQQNTWTVFRLTGNICTRVTSILRTTPSTLDEWRRIPKIGRHIGKIGAPTSSQWGWIQASNAQDTPSASDSSLGLPPVPGQATTGENEQSKLQQSLRLSRPLARRLRWNSR